jgi:hypothetical protein
MIPCHSTEAFQGPATTSFPNSKGRSPLRFRHESDKALLVDPFQGVPYGYGVSAAEEGSGRKCSATWEMV